MSRVDDFRVNPNFGIEEGDICNRKMCKGVIKISESENCSCHINSPCNSCLDVYLFCTICEWDDDEK